MRIASCICACFCFFALSSHAQNADSIFLSAREQAISKQYESSRATLYQLLQSEPGYQDAALLLGVTWLWEGDFARGLSYLDSLQLAYPTWQELFLSRVDGRLWSNQWQSVLTLMQQATEFPALDTNQVNWIKARAYHGLENYEVSLGYTQKLLDAGQSYPNLVAMHQVNLQASRRQHALVDYQFSTFDANIPNWQWLSFEYGTKVKSGPLLVRGTWINRFNLNSTQLEAEWYPRLNSSTYMYLGVGVGSGLLFPGFRSGAEMFKSLKYDIELSAGWRFINFSDSRIHSITLSAGKYWGKYWLNVRPFIIPTAGNIYLTNTFHARRFLNGGNSWVGFTYGIGNSPDMDFRLNSPDAAPSNQLFLLSANLFRLDLQWQFKGPWLVRPFAEYKKEEFIPGNFRTRMSFGSTFMFQF